VLDLSGDAPRLLRPGGATIEAIEALIGPISVAPSPGPAGPLRSPGLMLSHYAPRLPVRLAASAVASDEALLAFGAPIAGAGALFNLSAAGDPIEAAARLFTGLRRLDAEGARLGLRGIAVMPVPASGLGHAINDRLNRSAAPRSA
jgi:L-threonylcarbamoyladenylate synthase